MPLLLLGACAADADSPFRFERLAVRDSVTHTVALDGRTLVLQAETGRIEVVGSDTATVATVQVIRTARGATEGSARLRLDQGGVVRVDGDAEIVQLIAPAPQPPGTETAFTATVPTEARLHLQLDTGTITLADLAGPSVTAQTGTGDVRATGLAADTTTLAASTGRVEATVGVLPPAAMLSATTESGPIALALPVDAAAAVEAASLTGRVRLDGLALADEVRTQTDAGQRVTGRLGPEGPRSARVEARAVVGAVIVRGRSASRNVGRASRGDDPLEKVAGRQ